MKSVLLAAVLAASLPAWAASNADVKNEFLGFGNEMTGAQPMEQVGEHEGIYHVPGYLPGHPTAATIWPRVVEVKCKKGLCDGPQWTPALGRGEYLYVQAVHEPEPVKPPPPPVILEKKIRE